MESFADKVYSAVKQKRSHIVVGLDPVVEQIPAAILGGKGPLSPRQACEAIRFYNRLVIDEVADIAVAVKPQSAFYELHGMAGMAVFADTVAYAATKGLLVIGDVKRGDVGSTAAAYAKAYLGRVSDWPVDAVTVNPYLGTDSLMPFVAECETSGKGIFVLVKTSNPSSVEIQDLVTEERITVAEKVARIVEQLGRTTRGSCGYHAVGAVVGATHPRWMKALRRIMPGSLFLLPGYGAQGGTAADVVDSFDAGGFGALVAASRSVMYPFPGRLASEGSLAEIREAVRHAAESMRAAICEALNQAGKAFPW
jgi:orotidine-5'-phosphate decarboxylase